MIMLSVKSSIKYDDHTEFNEYFNSREFDSPDIPYSGNYLNKDLLRVLYVVRLNTGVPMIITSGIRSVEHNNLVGGVSNSEHLYGDAVDIFCPTSKYRYDVLKELFRLRINRIGIKNNMIHIGVSEVHVKEVFWMYK